MNFCGGQQVVQIDRRRLLAKLQENRAAHERIFVEARTGYRKAAVARLKEMWTEAKGGGQVQEYLGLTKPQHHLPEYDRVIAMVHMSVDSVTTLTEQQFAQFVMDDWQWKRGFLTTCVSFTTMAGSGWFAVGS